jgi:hypothetical protein
MKRDRPPEVISDTRNRRPERKLSRPREKHSPHDLIIRSTIHECGHETPLLSTREADILRLKQDRKSRNVTDSFFFEIERLPADPA